jgi:membrane protease YdiL (CAAX protease family)
VAWITRQPVLAFFGLAFLGTWLIILPLALATGEYGLDVFPFEIPEGLDFLLVQLSAYTGPLLAAFLVTGAIEGREGVRALRRRIVQWRVGAGWYLIALFAPLAIWLTAYGTVLGGDPFSALADDWTILLTAFLPFVLIGLILPSLGEEPGWRGFALPRLQEQWGPVYGTLILGTLHGLWHLPVFFTAGLGPFYLHGFTTFMLTAIAASFLYTWVANSVRGSILLVIILHSASNAATGVLNEIIPEDDTYSGITHYLVEDGWANVIAFSVVAIGLIVATRGRLGYHAGGTPSPTA